jgi:ribosomal protein S18 acetylase RimI-like enzyme
MEREGAGARPLRKVSLPAPPRPNDSSRGSPVYAPNCIAYRAATIVDLDAIVRLRIEFERITRDSGSLDEAARSEELGGLFGPDLESGTLRAYLAEAGALAVAGLPLGAVAQSALRLLGDGEGEILNVYTIPAYRRRGIGSELVDLAIAEAVSLRLRRLTLQCTEDSRRIYESRGFHALRACRVLRTRDLRACRALRARAADGTDDADAAMFLDL